MESDGRLGSFPQVLSASLGLICIIGDTNHVHESDAKCVRSTVRAIANATYIHL